MSDHAVRGGTGGLGARLRLLLAMLFFSLATVPLAAVTFVVEARRVHVLLRFTCAATLALAGIRLRVRGLGHVLRRGGFLIVCNHVNMFDALIVYALLPRYCVVFEKASHFRRPFYGRMVAAWGNLPVAPGQADLNRRSMWRAAQALHEGTPVVIFPEGTRHGDARLGAFKHGAFHLALEARVPVVPVVFKGAERILHDGGVRPGVEDVVVLAPESVEAYGPHEHEVLAAALHTRIEACLEAP